MSLLLPALASKVSTQTTSSPNPVEEPGPYDPQSGPQPYLTAVGPPPLRFEDVLPPPDLSTYLPAGAPPKVPEKPKDSPERDVILPKPAPAASSPSPKSHDIQAGPPPAPTPAPILPDDVPAQVRPEDFLPYFQYPGAGPRGRSAETPPAPPLPRSTATYTQGQ